LIESYRFGEVVAAGSRFTSDITITSNGSISGWWRREGHVLNVEDLKGLLSEDLEVLVIGTGSSGLLLVPEEIREHLRDRSVELIAQRTGSACDTYNRLIGQKRVALAIHLTC
jgi:hypothetical protein